MLQDIPNLFLFRGCSTTFKNRVAFHFKALYCEKGPVTIHERRLNAMNMKIENLPSCSVAYIRKVGVYGADNIRTMEQLKHWAEANNLMNNKTVIFGIAHDNPQTTPPENCRYDACILLANKHFEVDGNVQYGEIGGGKYAVFSVQHTAKAVEQAWEDIFPLLFEGGYLYDATRAIIERYAAEMVDRHLCEICVPIY